MLQYERGLNYWFFDIGEFISTTNDPLLEEQLNKVVIYYKHTKYFYGTIPLEKSSGLSFYIPNNISKYDKVENYYKQLLWTKESGIHGNLFVDINSPN